MITKYGYSTVGIVTTIVFLFLVISVFIGNNTLKYTIIALSVLFMVFTLYFFRDPERKIPQLNNAVISPADGTVLLIKDVEENIFIKGKSKQISIFMSPFNVHVNRIPITGKVEYLEYIHGKYLIASHDKADKENERNLIGIASGNMKVLFSQVAGMVARRIVCDLKPGQEVKLGDKFGMIKFGSRVDVIVPDSCTVKVKEGDKVTSGETILFEY